MPAYLVISSPLCLRISTSYRRRRCASRRSLKHHLTTYHDLKRLCHDHRRPSLPRPLGGDWSRLAPALKRHEPTVSSAIYITSLSRLALFSFRFPNAHPWSLQRALAFELLSTLLTILTLFLSIALYRLFFHPLNRYPGPRIAKLTSLWRLYNRACRKEAWVHRDLHDRYGDIVRIGASTSRCTACRMLMTEGRTEPSCCSRRRGDAVHRPKLAEGKSLYSASPRRPVHPSRARSGEAS